MAYPAPPDFASAGAYDAWWQYATDAGAADVCASSGPAVVRRVRAALGMGGGGWDDALQAGLVSRAQALSGADPAWGPIASQAAADAAARVVGPASLALGVWLAYYAPGGLRFDALAIPSGFVPPAWNAPASGGSDALVCWDPASQPRPELLDASSLAAAVAASASGVRGGQAPAAKPGAPGGLVGPEGVALVLVGVGAVALVVAVYVATRPRRNPRRRGRRS
jgi:hypothetical protein